MAAHFAGKIAELEIVPVRQGGRNGARGLDQGRWVSSDRVPRTVVAISEPIAPKRHRHHRQRHQRLDQGEAGDVPAAA